MFNFILYVRVMIFSSDHIISQFTWLYEAVWRNRRIRFLERAKTDCWVAVAPRDLVRHLIRFMNTRDTSYYVNLNESNLWLFSVTKLLQTLLWGFGLYVLQQMQSRSDSFRQWSPALQQEEKNGRREQLFSTVDASYGPHKRILSPHIENFYPTAYYFVKQIWQFYRLGGQV